MVNTLQNREKHEKGAHCEVCTFFFHERDFYRWHEKRRDSGTASTSFIFRQNIPPRKDHKLNVATSEKSR